jgi:hypothetical protein
MAEISKLKDFFNGRFFWNRNIKEVRLEYKTIELLKMLWESIGSNSNHYIGTIVLSQNLKMTMKKILHVVDEPSKLHYNF